jgi:serine/threonine protein kinase
VRICPRCSSVYTNGSQWCGLDGQPTFESEQDPLVGSTIDRYRVEERLGVGGMGCVYRARHTVIEREYAIKVLFGDFSSDERFRARFKREAQVVSKIRHPNVVSVDDFGTTPNGLTFLAMELVRGRTLEQVIEREGALAPARAGAIARQVAAGLSAAHRLGLVHRDIKPANVMLTRGPEGEQAKLLDFGAVGLRTMPSDERLTSVGHIIGTPTYMAPEQTQDALVGPTADLYALGVMLFEMLAGVPPFVGAGRSEVLIKHITEEPPPAPSSRGLESVVKRLLEKLPDARPQTADEVIELIDRLSLTKNLGRGDEVTGVTPQGWSPTSTQRPAIRPDLVAERFHSAPTDHLPEDDLFPRSSPQPAASDTLPTSSAYGASAVPESGPAFDTDPRQHEWPPWILESSREPLPASLQEAFEESSEPGFLVRPVGTTGELAALALEPDGASFDFAETMAPPDGGMTGLEDTAKSPLSGRPPRLTTEPLMPTTDPEHTVVVRERVTPRSGSVPPTVQLRAPVDDLLFEPSRPEDLAPPRSDDDGGPTQVDFQLEDAPGFALASMSGGPSATTPLSAQGELLRFPTLPTSAAPTPSSFAAPKPLDARPPVNASDAFDSSVTVLDRSTLVVGEFQPLHFSPEAMALGPHDTLLDDPGHVGQGNVIAPPSLRAELAPTVERPVYGGSGFDAPVRATPAAMPRTPSLAARGPSPLLAPAGPPEVFPAALDADTEERPEAPGAARSTVPVQRAHPAKRPQRGIGWPLVALVIAATALAIAAAVVSLSRS